MAEKIFSDAIEQNGVLRITIPPKFAEFLGIKKGDRVAAWIEKVELPLTPKEDE